MDNVVEFAGGMYLKDSGVMSKECLVKLSMGITLEIFKMREDYLVGELESDISKRLEFEGYNYVYEGEELRVSRGVKLALGSKEFDHNKVIRSIYRVIDEGVECNE